MLSSIACRSGLIDSLPYYAMPYELFSLIIAIIHCYTIHHILVRIRIIITSTMYLSTDNSDTLIFTVIVYYEQVESNLRSLFTTDKTARQCASSILLHLRRNEQLALDRSTGSVVVCASCG